MYGAVYGDVVIEHADFYGSVHTRRRARAPPEKILAMPMVSQTLRTQHATLIELGSICAAWLATATDGNAIRGNCAHATTVCSIYM